MATNRRRATTDDRHVAPTGGSAVSDGGGRGSVSSGRGGASGYNRRTQSARLAAPSWTCHFLENAAAGASPTSVDFLPVIASVLTQLTASNTRTYGDSGLLTRFTASAIPGMSVADYLKRIVKYGPCSKECYIIAMIYIDRVVSRNAGFLISNWNIHRLLITALLCASKFNDDLFYKNVYFAQVGGVPTAELAALELDFLFLIGFDLKVTTEVYTRYTRQLLHNRDFMDHAYVVALAGFHVYITPVVVEEEERKRKRKCKTAKKASFEILPGGPRLPNTQSSAAAVAAAGSTGEAKSGSTLPKQDEARQQRRRQGPARPKRSQTAPSISAVQVEPRVVVEGASGEAASDAPAANGRPQREDATATGDAPSGSRRLLSVSSEPTSEPQTRSSPQSPVETAPLVRSVSNGAPPRDRKAMAVALKKLQERKEQEEREIMRGIPVHLRGRFSSASARLQPPSPHELNAVPKAQRRRRRGSAPSLGARLPSDQRIQQLMGRRRLSKQNQPGWVASGNEFAVPTPDLGMTSSGGESGTSPGSSSPSSVRPRRMPRRRGPVGAIIAAGASAGRRHRMAADTTSSDVADASSEALDRSSGGLPGRDGAETLTAPAGRPGALVTERRRSSIDAFLRHQRRTKRRESREAGRGKSSRSRSRSRARFRRQREREELLVSQAVAIIEQEVADRELDPSLVAMASTFLSERVVQSDVEPKGGDVESGGNDDAAVFKNRKKSQGRRTRTNAGGKNDIAAARARFLRKRRSLKTASLTNLTRQVTTTQAEQASGINVSSSESGSEAPRPRLAASRGLKRASSLGAHMGDGVAGRRRLHRSNSSDMTFSPVTARLWVAFTELVADCAPLSPSLLGRAADVLHIPAATAEALGVQRGISSSSVATSPVHRFDNRVNAPGDGVSPVLHALEANESAAAAAAAVATLS